MSTVSYSQSLTADSYEEDDASDDTKQEMPKLDVHKLHRHDIVK